MIGVLNDCLEIATKNPKETEMICDWLFHIFYKSCFTPYYVKVEKWGSNLVPCWVEYLGQLINFRVTQKEVWSMNFHPPFLPHKYTQNLEENETERGVNFQFNLMGSYKKRKPHTPLNSHITVLRTESHGSKQSKISSKFKPQSLTCTFLP